LAGSIVQALTPLPPVQATFIASPRMTAVSWQKRAMLTASGCRRTVPVTGRFALIRLPFACETITEAMPMPWPSPPISIGLPAALLTTIMAEAPAASAICAL
jgi:hypothetical protein